MSKSLSVKLGGSSLILGSLLFAVYSSLFPILLPLGNVATNYADLVQNPNYVRLAAVVFVGILLMMIGFFSVYNRMRDATNGLGIAGILFIEAAYFLQACKVTWELFMYPIIASHAETAFLLKDMVIKNDPNVVLFNLIASIVIFVGVVLFCLSVFRSKKFPAVAPVLIFVGAVVYALGPMISVFVAIGGIFTLAIGCLILGIRLLRD